MLVICWVSCEVWNWFLHHMKFYWRVHFSFIYWDNCYFFLFPIRLFPFLVYLLCLNNCESCIFNIIIIQYFFKSRSPTFAKVDEKFVSGITSIVGKSTFLVNFLWCLIKSLGVGIYLKNIYWYVPLHFWTF